MKSKVILLASLAAMGAASVKAQTNVGATTPPVAGAMLQVSGTAAGFLPPVMTTSNRNAIPTPPTGLVIFNSTTNQMEVNTGTTTAPIWSAASTVADLRLLGNGNHVSADAGVSSNGTSLGSGTSNIAIGQTALNAVTSGSSLVAIGGNALKANTTGISNIAVGTSALQTNIVGGSNTAVGDNALANNNGNQNTAIGSGALRNGTNLGNNVAVGVNTLYSISGGSNSVVGGAAFQNLSTGDNNSGLGYSAGSNLSSGSNNIAIGVNTTLPSATGSNQLNIGNTIWGTGFSGTNTGSVGIGTNAPTSKFTVNGAATNLSAYNAAAAAIIDFSLSNLAYTTANAGAFIINNLKDGGTYTLAVQGSVSGTSTFTAPISSGGNFTVHLPVDNGATTAGKHTVYTFLVIGTNVYMSWITGL